jgi:hypothetical protein
VAVDLASMCRALILTALLLAGCASKHESVWEKTGLIGELGQPRLAELLAYLAENGIPAADDATVFEFTHWVMYAEHEWHDRADKPRYEGADFHHGENRVIVAISPVGSAYEGPDEYLLVPSDEGKAATLLPRGRRWSASFNLKHSDDGLRELLTQRLGEFVTRVPAPPGTRPR